MPKAKTGVTNEEAEAVFGGASLLDRLGKGRPVVETAPAEQEEKRQSAKAPKRQSAQEAVVKSEHVRISVYLTPDDLEALDQQVIKARRRAERRKDRSALIREAIRFWLAAQG